MRAKLFKHLLRWRKRYLEGRIGGNEFDRELSLELDAIDVLLKSTQGGK